MDTRRISLLPQSTRECITAHSTIPSMGEAIYAVIENAVHASATHISLNLDISTLSFHVQDDGCGLTQDDWPLVGLQWYTSKHRLGAKGCSLASLKSCSHVEITSNGTRLLLTDSTRRELHCSGLDTTHTCVKVKNMYHNLPVRRKQLESEHLSSIIQPITSRLAVLVCSAPGLVLELPHTTVRVPNSGHWQTRLLRVLQTLTKSHWTLAGHHSPHGFAFVSSYPLSALGRNVFAPSQLTVVNNRVHYDPALTTRVKSHFGSMGSLTCLNLQDYFPDPFSASNGMFPLISSISEIQILVSHILGSKHTTQSRLNFVSPINALYQAYTLESPSLQKPSIAIFQCFHKTSQGKFHRPTLRLDITQVLQRNRPSIRIVRPNNSSANGPGHRPTCC